MKIKYLYLLNVIDYTDIFNEKYYTVLFLLKMGYIWLYVQFQADQYKIQEKKYVKWQMKELFDIFTKLC